MELIGNDTIRPEQNIVNATFATQKNENVWFKSRNKKKFKQIENN